MQGAFQKPSQEPAEMVCVISIPETSPVGVRGRNGKSMTTRWLETREAGQWKCGCPRLTSPAAATCYQPHCLLPGRLLSAWCGGGAGQVDRPMARKSTQAPSSPGQRGKLWATLEVLENHPVWGAGVALTLDFGS